jgi:putative membrane protein
MSLDGLRRGAGALIAANLALVVFSLLGTRMVGGGLPVPSLNFERLASATAQSSILLGVLAALALMIGSQGPRAACFLLLVSTGVGGAMEWMALCTGVPFGHYSYTPLLGPMLGGTLPLLIPLAWFTAISMALHVAHRLSSRPIWVILCTASLVTLWDLVLEPAMTTGFAAWHWADSGFYYGVPLRNFAAWFATAAVVTGLFKLSAHRWRADQSSLSLWLYLVQGSLPAGLCLLYGRPGATLLWAAGVGLIGLSLAHPGRKYRGEKT